MKFPLRSALAIILLTACQTDKPRGSEQAPFPKKPHIKTLEQVLARVNGIPLTLTEYQADTQTKGTLDNLIRREVLAQEGLRQKLNYHPDVIKEARQMMVRLYLAREFEAKYTKKNLPESLLKRAYKSNYYLFHRPARVHCDHILVEVPKPASKTRKATLKQIALEIAREARATVKTRGDFHELYTRWAKKAKAKKIRMRLEHLRVLRVQVVKPFADAAFAMNRKGQLGGPVRTSYGWHIIRYRYREPPVDKNYQDARAEVLKRVFPEWRRAKFLVLADRLQKKYNVKFRKNLYGFLKSKELRMPPSKR